MTRLLGYDAQLDFLTSEAKIASFVGGIGSGKTRALATWIVMTALKYPGSKGLIVANTYEQLVTATLVHVIGLLEELNIPFRKVGKILTINGGADIYCRSLEKYDNIRGIEVGWIASDELAFAKQEAYEVILGRLRDRKGPLQFRSSTSPNGFNWFERLARDPDNHLVSASCFDNPFLPDGYAQALLKQYDPKMARQEIYGEFVNITSGQAYYSFERELHVIDAQNLRDNLPGIIHVGVDFNVSPITAVLAQWDLQQNKLIVFDEIYEHDSNTEELAQIIRKRAGKSHVIVYPDATGRARKTSAAQTDLEILRNHGFELKVGRTNPQVKDRVNAVNNGIYRGNIRIGESCVYTIKDLEQVSWQHLLRQKAQGELTHISDALGYLVWGVMPLKRPKRPNRPHKPISLG